MLRDTTHPLLMHQPRHDGDRRLAFIAQLLQNTRESGLLAEYGSNWLYRFPLEFHSVFFLVLP